MSGRNSSVLDETLTRQLGHLKKYGELVEHQLTLIEEKDYEGLLDVLERKQKVIERMGDPARLERLATEHGPGDGGGSERTRRLFEEFISRLEFFSACDAESMEKASGFKAELAGSIHALRKGKRMLRKYSEAQRTGKARFKDLTG